MGVGTKQQRGCNVERRRIVFGFVVAEADVATLDGMLQQEIAITLPNGTPATLVLTEFDPEDENNSDVDDYYGAEV